MFIHNMNICINILPISKMKIALVLFFYNKYSDTHLNINAQMIHFSMMCEINVHTTQKII